MKKKNSYQGTLRTIKKLGLKKKKNFKVKFKIMKFSSIYGELILPQTIYLLSKIIEL